MAKPRFTLRKKLLFFAVLLAIIPLVIAGRRMIVITQDELKSAANDELSVTAEQLAREIDALYTNTWLAPLLLIRNGIDNEQLGAEQKVALLTSVEEVTDIVSLQLNVQGIQNPMFVLQDVFVDKLKQASLTPEDVLILPWQKIQMLCPGEEVFGGDLTIVQEIPSWLITIVVPLKNTIGGRRALLTARINLERLQDRIQNHPFTKTGGISLVDSTGVRIFDPEATDLSEFQVVQFALSLLKSDSRAIGIQPYTQPSGEKMLGAFSFPMQFDWVVVSERSEKDAYLAVTVMFRSLVFWVLIGFLVAIGTSLIFAQRISRPILEIGKVAQTVGAGNFNVRVNPGKSNDEISDLGKRFNTMIAELRERFELQKFVSGQTMDAIKQSDQDGIKLGGERKKATVFFADIRGFTQFSEQVEPETVIKMLNTYLRSEAKIVQEFGGDIDKFVGDELVAVFEGEHMVENAINCAIRIQETTEQLNSEYPEWDIPVGIGINTGDVIMGAMGSEDRMDYTIIGDTVNLASRLCTAAKGNQTIISENTYNAIKKASKIHSTKLPPIQVKGKAQPIQIYEVSGNVKKKSS